MSDSRAMLRLRECGNGQIECTIIAKKQLSHNSFDFTFSLPSPNHVTSPPLVVSLQNLSWHASTHHALSSLRRAAPLPYFTRPPVISPPSALFQHHLRSPFTPAFSGSWQVLGLPVGQHVRLVADIRSPDGTIEKDVTRSYTVRTKPSLCAGYRGHGKGWSEREVGEVGDERVVKTKK